jgi:hypothetical protein
MHSDRLALTHHLHSSFEIRVNQQNNATAELFSTESDSAKALQNAINGLRARRIAHVPTQQLSLPDRCAVFGNVR